MLKGGLGGMMKQAQKMQADMQQAQQEIAAMEITGQSGGGLVKVTLMGTHECRRVELDPSLMEDDDKEMIEDLMAAAFNDAVQRLDATTKERMSNVTSGMQLPEGMKLPF